MNYDYIYSASPILIGSAALRLHFDIQRPPGDMDYILPECLYTQEIFKRKKSSKDIEYKVLPTEIFDLIKKSSLSFNYMRYASLETLYTIKVSHAEFDIHWNKTMHDIKLIQKFKPDIEVDEELFENLYAHWLVVHKNNKDKINLRQTNEEFFNDRVKRKYVHDDLHKAVALYGEPMYLQLKPNDPNSAFISKEEFYKLEDHKKLALALEEIYVTALERFLIPKDMKYYSAPAFYHATKQLVTSMTKGWFPQYIIRNWSTILTEFQKDTKAYVKMFKEAEISGRIRLVE